MPKENIVPDTAQSRTRQLYDAFEGFINSIGIWLIVGLMLLTVADITFRTITNRSIPGAYELVELMLGGCFLAISYTQKQKGHVRMDLVLLKLPPKSRRISEIAALIMSLGICIIILIQTISQVALALEMGIVSSGVVPFPVWPTRTALSIGFFLISIRILLQIVDMLWARTGKAA